MSLNNTQKQYLEEVIQGKLSAERVVEDFADVDGEAYKNENFREMLFAIDALNEIGGSGWTRVFVRGLVEKSDWLETGELKPSTLSEIADNQSRYGRGEYSIAVVIDLIEEATKKPSNALSFARRTIREHFNGIQPVTEHCLFQIKRYFEARQPLSLEDVEIVLHINEETKGLENSVVFDRFFAMCLRDAAIDVEGKVNHPIADRVRRAIKEADETTETERLLVRLLRDRGLELPKEVLSMIDLRKERLLGLA